MRRGHRGGTGGRGVQGRAAGRGGGQRVRAARRVQLGPGQPVRGGPAGRRAGARRLRHGRLDRDARRAARRGPARGHGVRHRPRPRRPARRPAPHRLRGPGHRARRDRGALQAGRAGRGSALRGSQRRRHGRRAARARRDHERARGRPHLPGRGRVVQRPGGDRGPARPRSRPRRGHRQDQAGPALERLLRQGARRPVLPVVRSREVRRALRARRHRLPDRLRPVDRASQPRMLPRSHRAQGTRGRDARLRRLPVREREHRLRRPVVWRAQGRGRPAGVPGPARGRGQPAAGGAQQHGPGQHRGAAAGQGQRAAGDRVHRGRQMTPPRCCCRSSPGWRRPTSLTWPRTGRCPWSTRSGASGSPRRRPAPAPCSRTPPSTRSSS